MSYGTILVTGGTRFVGTYCVTSYSNKDIMFIHLSET
ncbi:unnamed protein product [Debaryomyces tyrocola]|nr:unnamed protein product [Debaryomyces tyrocola]